MKPRTARMSMVTGPRAASVPGRPAHSASLHSYQHGNACARLGITHLHDSGCAGESGGDMPLWRRQTSAFAAAHPET